MRIEMLVFDGVDEMDVMGPFEVWSHAAARSGELELVLVGAGRPGRGHRHARPAVPRTGRPGYAERPVRPGGGWLNQADSGAWAEAQRGVLPARLAELAPQLDWIASVCTGSMLLGEAGLVKGRPATTNRNAWEDFATAYGPVLKQNRVVDDGTLVTAGGITAGIDLAFRIVERELSPELADTIARSMEYTRDRDLYVSAA